jgi:ATP-dependent Clp protease ATP-binding subunit ClpC
MVTMGKLPQTPRAKKVIEYSMEEARNLNHNYVGTEHMLLGLLREQEGVAAQVLMNLGLKLEEVREEVLNLLGARHRRAKGANASLPIRQRRRAQGRSAGGGGGSGKGGKSKTPALDSFGRDLTELAREGKLDPVIGREREIERVIQILCRRTKNNPVLLGEAGVGKTAIVEGSPSASSTANVPEILRQADRRARPGDDGRRHEVPRPVRRAHQGGDERSSPRQEHDPVHRRAAHARRRRRRRRARSTPATCSSRRSPRRDPVHRRHDARRVPQVHREGRRARAPLPDRSWSSRRAREQTIEILKGLRDQVRSAPPRADHRRRARSGRRALEPLHHRPLPAGQGDRRDRRSRRPRATQGHDQAAGSEGDRRRSSNAQREKEEAVANQDFEKAAALRDQADKLRKKKDRPSSASGARPRKLRATDGVVDEEVIAEVVSKMTGIPLTRMTTEDRAPAPDGRENCTRRSSARTRRSRRSQGRPPQRSGLKDPQAADRLLHLRRPHRRRQDAARQGAGRVHVRRRGRAHSDRHERVHGEAQRQPPDRRASGLRRLRRRRPAHREDPPPSVLRSCCSTKSRRRIPTSSTCCCRSWKKAG